MTVYSHPGVGLTFKIFFPRLPENDTAPEPGREALRASPPLPGGSETILLVEDEELVANHLSRLLRGHGYRVLVAPSGAKAIALMKERQAPVDLVLTDVIMPAMNGRELVASLRETFPALRALFMSGYPSEIVAKHGVLDAGIQFVEKPFFGEHLMKKIREILDA